MVLPDIIRTVDSYTPLTVMNTIVTELDRIKMICLNPGLDSRTASDLQKRYGDNLYTVAERVDVVAKGFQTEETFSRVSRDLQRTSIYLKMKARENGCPGYQNYKPPEGIDVR
jgi:hypothetical protein